VHRSGMNFTVVDRSRPREDRLDSSLALTWTHVTSAENDDRCSNKLITMELVAEGSARWAGTPGPGFLSPFPIAAWNLRSAPHSDAVRTQTVCKATNSPETVLHYSLHNYGVIMTSSS
jgi:hypothetical protein